MSDINTNIEYSIKPNKDIRLGVQELWSYRELFYFFSWRDIKVKYKQTLLGFLWAILQPLLMMMIFVVFFSKFLNVPTDHIPAPVFYFSGLLLWNLFSSGLSNSANSMVDNANIIKKVYFPRLIIPLSSLLVSGFDFLMGFIIFLGILLYYYFSVPDFSFSLLSFALYFPLGFLLAILSACGLGTFLASLNVKYRDFRYVIPFLIQFLLFISPVIYPVSILKDSPILEKIAAINPLTGALILGRAGLTAANPDWMLVGISFVSAILLAVVGLYYFRKTESYFADLA